MMYGNNNNVLFQGISFTDFAFIYWVEFWVNQTPQTVKLSMYYFTYAYVYPLCFMPLVGTQAHRLAMYTPKHGL